VLDGVEYTSDLTLTIPQPNQAGLGTRDRARTKPVDEVPDGNEMD
jgi:hypothetical protein